MDKRTKRILVLGSVYDEVLLKERNWGNQDLPAITRFLASGQSFNKYYNIPSEETAKNQAHYLTKANDSDRPLTHTDLLLEKVCEAVAVGGHDYTKMRKKLIQVAAAVAMVESLDRNELKTLTNENNNN